MLWFNNPHNPHWFEHKDQTKLENQWFKLSANTVPISGRPVNSGLNFGFVLSEVCVLMKQELLCNELKICFGLVRVWF